LKTVRFIIPIKTVSEANARETRMIQQRRAKAERAKADRFTCDAMETEFPLFYPCTVTMTRLGPRPLDDDNLAVSLKHVRDGIAQAFGVDDGDKRWKWVPKQEASKVYGVRVEIEREQI
jgi:hypothetical protein